MVITEETLERALAFIAQTDHEYGQWKAMVLRTEYLAKVKESMTYSALDEASSIENRKRLAQIDPEVQKANEEHFNCVSKFEVLRARRARAIMTVELFRTLEASRRQGNI